MIRAMTRVLLAGGGHTHLVAGPLVAAAARGASLALVAPSPRLLYSGMMPGWLAGRHPFEACAIDLRRVAEASGIDWIEDAVVGLDLAARCVVGAGGRRYPYELLSLNVGSENPPGASGLEGDPVTVLGAKPFEAFVAGWTAWLASAPAAPRCVVVGGGAAAVEIAFALAARCASGGPMAGGRVELATAGDALLPGLSRMAAAIAARSLARRGVALRFGLRYVGTDDGAARFVATRDAVVAFPADLVVVATGGRPPGWLTEAARAAGLPVGPEGGVAVDACLRSPADDRVFAAGDCASIAGGTVPKSGVHALRQGAPLAASILARLGGADPRCEGPARYVPQRRALALLDRCDGSAIAAWGTLGAAGPVFARWKHRIDRGFVARFPRDDARPGDAV
ncbi:MAG: hypothetical protein RJA99_2558 [Pseudomonadota bacterium]|jgi:NADH dehydrogenase FAD-containing subunit